MKLKTKTAILFFAVALVFLTFFITQNLDSILTGIKEYRNIFLRLSKGIFITIYVSLFSYLASVFLGLVFALLRLSKIKLLSRIMVFYIEFVRSLPILLVLFYMTYIGTPFLISLINYILAPLIKLNLLKAINIKSIGFTSRAIVALVFCYSVFISEIFRAGIESINKGQREASLALGLSKFSMMKEVILPQAFKNISPTLINQLVAIVKDSALVSVLGVKDITFLGRAYSASTFKFFETYNVVAFIYLIIIFLLSLFAKRLEKKLK